ncbi:hypothetical protein CC77DRAFT_1012719 [Alternaria alternata]|uniref:Uncharacterized protein n=1 Tax=Alternaria alternata TaxID=5599 RepID=A0A177D8N1_ALTAL|nr:hypothetical protein CC77DRAFT_1012719 [Alternaria alternata]OAG16045.1 hypothetical protein CC77DRAFT_1012719 [Alternaria alternata]
MPSFQRLKHPFRRPTHYYTIHEPSPTPRQLEERREKERRRARDKIENDLDDGRVGPRSSDSPDELPVIIDRGPYRGHIYPREQLFFNSIMLASDVEPICAGPLGGELRQEVHRAPIRRPKTQREQKPRSRPVPSEYLTASQNAENLRQWEERNKVHEIEQREYPRPVPSEYLTAKQNAENLRRWKERSRSLAAPRAQVLMRTPSSPRPPSPPRGPITPGTREWDGFMDFPLDNSVYADGSKEATVDVPDSACILPTIFTPDAPPHLTDAPETDIDSVPQADFSSTPTQSDCSQKKAEGNASRRLEIRLSTGSEQPERLTWNSALNSIIRNEAVDPVMRARVRERIERSLTSADQKLFDKNSYPVTMKDAGLVPNFSHPSAGSEFHDRLQSGQADRSLSLEKFRQLEEQQEEQSLPNGVNAGYHNRSNSSSALYCSPPHSDWPLRGGNEESPPQLTNGVPPGYYSSSSGSSDDSNHDPYHRPPSPPDRVPEHVFAFLCSLLTPSELALHYDVIYDSAPPYPPPFPNLVPRSNAMSAIPLDVRLVQKLHTAVYGLQDRIVGVEEDLIPELSTNLENKHLQRRRKACRGRLAHMFSRGSDATIREDELLHSHKPGDYVAQTQLFGRAAQGPLKKKELDAVLLMAKQNVSILIEDLGEAKGLVEAFEERNEVNEEVLPAESCWKLGSQMRYQSLGAVLGDRNVRTSDDWTHMIEAFENDHESIVDILIDWDADVSTLTEDGRTALSIAEALGQLTIVGKFKCAISGLQETMPNALVENCRE